PSPEPAGIPKIQKNPFIIVFLSLKFWDKYTTFPGKSNGSSRTKWEFARTIEFPVIASQSSDWRGNPPVRRTTFSWIDTGKRQVRTDCMTISCPEFDGDSHTRKENWFGMTRSDEAPNSNLSHC
ncbi:MAG: hypothetical protein PUJ12_01910, partial [Oscillospiraceae bacterium]|nr:hypothetical protein [Oscillospiraceae bacterium]